MILTGPKGSMTKCGWRKELSKGRLVIQHVLQQTFALTQYFSVPEFLQEAEKRKSQKSSP